MTTEAQVETYADRIQGIVDDVAKEAEQALQLGNSPKELRRGIKLQVLAERLGKLIKAANGVVVNEPENN